VINLRKIGIQYKIVRITSSLGRVGINGLILVVRVVKGNK